MKWITREKVKVDRVACPWLIKKFVDPEAEFLFVPAGKVEEVSKREKAIPYDVPEAELGHHGASPRGVEVKERCLVWYDDEWLILDTYYG